MMKVLIIDDEPLATELVKEYLLDFPQFEIIGICHNGFEGLKAIQEKEPDLIFLDVQMPKLNGFELLELLEKPPVVIFTTAYDEYAMKAFDAHALDYLLKPFSKSRFKMAVQKFLQFGQSTAENEFAKSVDTISSDTFNRVVMKIKNEIKIIPVNEIKYLEANDDYVNLYTAEGKFLKNKTMSFFEKTLETNQFVRVHRSYIVKISEIHKLEPYDKDGYVIILRGGEKIPVSKTGFPKLKSVLGI
ncbi:two component transcriptional regulator, LytTR family [Aquiflexum balticum DSM 16537]|uniref:Two component transcriptional regulator, LytTR family n=1 Tax=Aquiflexum balticum DSM 16537 TaxID=758820 RepID=A0A1W2H3C8_9BACT|nr:LytTR family transcriptional regulator DNA-binding domain-containing protein [Aquiflexum balticum]SMD43369.1 two component transcriptional regulator, LytTR family [Aquiflexum balticum DSM 16537]